MEDDQLRESVKAAIMAENIEALARIIDKLAVQVNHQKKTIQDLRDRLTKRRELNKKCYLVSGDFKQNCRTVKAFCTADRLRCSEDATIIRAVQVI